MKARLVLFCIWAITTGITANGPMPKPTEDRVMGQWIVRLAPSASLQNQPAVQARLSRWDRLAQIPEWHAQPLFPNQPKHRTSLTADSPLDRYVLITANPDGPDLGPVLATHPDIELVEPNYTAFLTATPEEYQATHHWNLAAVNAPAAWEITRGDASQLIAVIDTGVHLDHPDLADRIWTNPAELEGDANSDGCPGLCGVDDDGDGLIDEDGAGRQPGEPGYDPSYAADDDENGYRDDFHGWNWAGINTENNNPTDDLGHGTHVAGIAAASADNGSPALGICPECRILPLKAFDRNGIGSFADIARAVDYARRAGATVINMSFSSLSQSTLLHDALLAAAPHAVLVASAGNDGESRAEAPYYPAAWDFVLGVESEDRQGQRSSFSNSGYDISAPGESIFSAFMSDGFTTWSGTSMAAPLMAGLAGLVRAHNPQFSAPLTQGQLMAADADAYQALTLNPQPDLIVLEVQVVDTVGTCEFCDGDGIADSSEEVDLVITLRNQWGAAATVDVVLETDHGDLTILKSGSSYGAIQPLQSKSNSHDPMRIALGPNIPDSSIRNLRIHLNGLIPAIQIRLKTENAINISGFISGDQHWKNDKIYHITGDTITQTETHLKIDPGTKITVTKPARLKINGTLTAIGTPDTPISFNTNKNASLRITLPFTQYENGEYASGAIFEFCNLGENIKLDTNNAYFNHCIINNNFTIRPGALVENTLFQKGEIGSDSIFEFGVRNSTIANINNQHQNAFMNIINNNFIFRNDFWIGFGWSSRFVELNYWGSSDANTIDELILDINDDIFRPEVLYEPFLNTPNLEAPVIVYTIHLNPPNENLFPYLHRNSNLAFPTIVGEDLVTFTVTFSRDMNTQTTPVISFGPQEPYTTHTVIANGHWLDERTWQAEKEISIYTGDGTQRVVVLGAEDFEGFPLPKYDYRHSFVIDTSNSGGRALGSTSDNGSICLNWLVGDERTIGYNIYRAPSSDGPFAKINSAIVADTQYEDHTVDPGVEYCYMFRPMTTGLLEGPDSLVSCNIALDSIAPEIQHLPVTQAATGRLLTLRARISDNVAVQEAVVYYRTSGDAGYTTLPMINAVDDQFTANVPAEAVLPPGLEYYISAYDGRNQTLSGSPNEPHIAAVVDEPVIYSLSPVEGSPSGGETVTIQGVNFQPDATVRFGQEAALVTSWAADRLEVITPAHHPWLTSVRVTNPDGMFDHAPNAYAYRGQAAALTAPQHTHEPGTSIQVPLTTQAAGFLSADFTLQFDHAVLDFTGAQRGALNADALVSVNETQPGQLQGVISGIHPVTGSGSIIILRFNVVGDPGSQSPLGLSDVVFNDGMIPVTLENGSISVDNTFDLSGAVRYYVGNQGVPQTQLNLSGDHQEQSVSDADGAWSFSAVPFGNQQLTLAKTGDDRGAVSALDANRLFSHINGQQPLDELGLLAGDVNRINGINAADVTLVLQRAVGLIDLPFPGSEKAWLFSPSERTWLPLSADQTQQDFKAILVGDVTGNWGSAPTPNLGTTLTLALTDHNVNPGETFTVDLAAVNITAPFAALDLVLTFDPARLTLNGVTTPLDALALHNQPQPGQLNIALAAQSQVDTNGVVLQLQFSAASNASGVTQLQFQSAAVDEGAQTAALESGQIEINGGIHIPDANFRTFLLTNYDSNGDGAVSQTEAAAVAGFMICTNLNIENLEGIQHFVNLRGLYCEGNRLTQLPNLSNLTQLQQLRCYNNQLTQLPDLSAMTNLNLLYAFNNRLTQLPDLSGLVRLERLYIMLNQLTSLPEMSDLTALKDFQCHYNQLTGLPDLSGLNNLQIIQAEYNQLSQFPDVANLPALRTLSIHHNNFEEDDCPRIQQAENMGLTSFSYNPQRDGTTLVCEACQPPAIFTQPFNVTVCSGEPVTFSVGAEATPPVTFQWRRNGVAVPNATDAVLSLPSAQINGSYTCLITNPCGSILSQTAFLTVESCDVDIEITPTPLTVTESGGVDVAWVSLSAAPTAPVTLTFSAEPADEVEVNTPQITFTTTDWSLPRAVLVRGRDDDQTDGPVSVTLVTHPADSTDTRYTGLDPMDIAVTNLDDDSPDKVLFEAPRHARAEAGQTVRIPLRVGGVNGVLGMQWRLDFDPQVLTYIGFDTTGQLFNDWTVNAQQTTPGHLIFGAFNAQPLEGSGTLIYLSFTVANVPASSQTNLTLSQVMLDAGFPAAEVVSGRFRVVTCRKGDMDSDGLFSQRDAGLALSRVVDQLHWEFPPTGEACVDTNCNGLVEAVDARLISLRALGLIDGFCADSVNNTADEMAVLGLDDLNLDPNTDFQTYLRILDITPELILQGFQMGLTYNPEVIQIQDIDLAEVGAGMNLTVNDRIPGHIKLAAYDLNGVEARSGLLLRVRGRAVGTGVTLLLPEDPGFNAGGPSLTVIPGRIQVGEVTIPTIVAEWPAVSILDLVQTVNQTSVVR